MNACCSGSISKKGGTVPECIPNSSSGALSIQMYPVSCPDHFDSIIPSTPRFQPQETIPNVITVFSAPNYIDRAGNMAAVAVLTNQGGNLDKQHLGRQR